MNDALAVVIAVDMLVGAMERLDGVAEALVLDWAEVVGAQHAESRGAGLEAVYLCSEEVAHHHKIGLQSLL